MPSRNVSLTDHHNSFIEASIAEGRFRDASEAVRAGLRLLELQSAEQNEKLAWLNGAVQEGIADMERGQFVELDSSDDIDRYISDIHADVIAEHGGSPERV
jgi:antitoxin ParD1/3/4